MDTMERFVGVYYGIYSIILGSCVVPAMGMETDCSNTTVDMYDGHQRTTADGTPCVRWDSVGKDYTKFEHKFPDATLSDAGNFCRAMGESYLWCWTSNDSYLQDYWGKCEIKKCVVIDCFLKTVDNYDGHQQTTRNGTPCIRWDSIGTQYTKFPDATLADAGNFCRARGKNYLWCWTSSHEEGKCGIKECDERSHVNKCGTLNIGQPALLGRNVTFSFTPDSHDPKAILEWQRSKKPNPWYTRPLTYKFTQFYSDQDKTFYMVLTDSKAQYDEVSYRIHYYNESTQCYMETEKLQLQDNPHNQCGFVYLRIEKVVEDDDIKLEYYPSTTSASFQHKWFRSRNGQPSDISVGNGIYTEDEKESGMYELTIYTIKESMNGNYGVRCGAEAGYNYTNNVSIFVLVPPSVPVFKGGHTIDGCKDCIVGYGEEKMQVRCETSGGTPTVKVNVILGDKSHKAIRNDNKSSIYTAFFTLSNSDHNSTITCSVMNEVLSSPRTISMKVYVIKSPTMRLSVPDEIKEGRSDVITCLGSSSRPAPKVYFNISGTEVNSTFANATYINRTPNLILKTCKREWNGLTISCCRYNEWYQPKRKCTESQLITLLFPPSHNKLEINYDAVNPLQMYAVCTVYNSNPICTVKFKSPSGTIESEKISRNVELPHGSWNSEYLVNLNVSQEDNGTDITCAVNYRSDIGFNISGTTLNISQGEETHVKCLADSFPASNITWIEEMKEGGGGDTIKRHCESKPDCVIYINADVISKRRFVCKRYYLQIHESMTLDVNTYKPRESTSSEHIGDYMIWIITGACIVLIIVVVILVIIVKKRCYPKAKKNPDQAFHRNSNDQERENVNGNDEGHAADQIDVVYSQPIKNKRLTEPAENETMYSEVNKVGKSKNQSPKCTADGQRSEDEQLTYIELDFDPNGRVPPRASAHRLDPPTEYVGIDFVKTAAYIANEDDTPTPGNDNIYANQ